MESPQDPFREILRSNITTLLPEFTGFKQNIEFKNQFFKENYYFLYLSDNNELIVSFEETLSYQSFGSFIQQYFNIEDITSTKEFIAEKLGLKEIDPKIDAAIFHDNVPEPIGMIDTSSSTFSSMTFNKEQDNFRKNSRPTIELRDTDILCVETLLMLKASKRIVIEPAIITYLGEPIIKKNTLNLIQGQFGSFKSRFSSFLITMMMGKKNGENLGFEKNPHLEILSCLVDTERNNTEELPYAIQSIFKITDTPFSSKDVFRCTSLKNVNRKSRLEKLYEYIHEVRNSSDKHIYLTIDVATDTIYDFNSVEESMVLLDFLGVLVEEQNLTVMLVIHENPGTRKARGHLGTEAWNKVSAAFRIGVLRNKDGSESDLIELDFLKLRASKKIPKIHMKFCEKTLDFKLANVLEVNAVRQANQQKANIEEVIAEIERQFNEVDKKIDQKTLIETLRNHFEVSKGTITTRLKSIVETGSEILDSDGVICFLKCHSSSGSTTFYTLETKISSVTEV
jgi:hypothetical protein